VQPVAHDEPARGQRIDSELKKLSRNREACLRLIKLNILQINSSARSTGSESTRHADIVVSRLKMTTHSATVIRRDLASAPLQHIDEFALTALFTAPEERNAEQAARVAIDDALIAEVQSADVLVIGAPMYNFGVTVQLKSWLDAIARTRVTFRYTESGPEGLHNFTIRRRDVAAQNATSFCCRRSSASGGTTCGSTARTKSGSR
jgi:multimeric flavodoxin WrbA